MGSNGCSACGKNLEGSGTDNLVLGPQFVWYSTLEALRLKRFD